MGHDNCGTHDNIIVLCHGKDTYSLYEYLIIFEKTLFDMTYLILSLYVFIFFNVNILIN